MATPRILLCGDVGGNFDQLFKRISSVNKANGPFDALLCVGQFFPSDTSGIHEVMQFVDGVHEIPLPTYFIGDYGETAGTILSSAKLKAGQTGLALEGIPVCKNLYWLKGSGIFHLEGLRVAYLAGKYVPSVYQDAAGAQSNGTYHEDDVDALRAFADESAINDLFLSNEWPQGVLDGVSGPSELDPSALGTAIVAELVAELKPRYHIAGSEGYFYTRDPYLNENASHVTRFVGLATVGNAKKQKFLHALSLTPATSMSLGELTQRPLNTTKSPYTVSARKDASKVCMTSKRSASLHDTEGQYWRYAAPRDKGQRGVGGGDKICFEFALKGSCSRGDACNFKHEKSNEKLLSKGACFDFVTKGKCTRGSECKFRHNLDEDKANTNDSGTRLPVACWFCLASPNVDTDLVIDVGDHCYCAMAKGGLVDGHVLLLPIEHFPSTLSLPEHTVEELKKYKRALRKLYKSQGKTLVIFERCLQFKGETHAHLQVVPILLSKASQVRSGFVSAAKEFGFSFQVIRPEGEDLGAHEALQNHLQGEKNYFFVELPEGTILVHVLDSRDSIPVQFGREVCARVLGVPERSDWRACKLSKDEERAMAEKFKEDFKAFEQELE
eukprot:c20756_g3_i1 orf=573-2408(-)